MKISIIMEHCLVPAIELSLPPRINTLYDPYEYKGRDGKMHLGLRLSPEGRRYKSEVAPLINIATRDTQELLIAIRKDKKRKLYIHSRCYFREDRTDVDAGLKALQDAIASCLDIDDKRVIRHTVDKFVDKSYRPGVFVEVYEAAWVNEEP